MDRGTNRTLIVVIDDNEDACAVLHALLDGRYEVVCFHDGPAALESIEGDRPALLLLDISLPGMNGIEVLRRARALRGLAHLPAIALTGHTLHGDRERLLAAGFDEYLSKPILDETELYAAIERLRARPGALDTR